MSAMSASGFTWRGTRCLVTGGAGNLGGQLIRLLRERGAFVSSLDLIAYDGPGAEGVRSFEGDICDAALLAEAMEGVAVVFHTASVIDIRPVPALRMWRVNVDGTYAVIGACKAAGVGRLVYTSSLEVVSGHEEDGTVRRLDGVGEDAPMPVRHHLPYAGTKAAAERLVLAAHSAELRTCAIRSGYIMGAGCIGLKVEMLRAKARRGYYVTAHIPAIISTVHAKNCAHAHVLAAERAERADVGGQPFFVRDYEANVVETALECFKATPIVPALIPLRLAFVVAWVLDCFDRLMHALCRFAGRRRETPAEVLDVTAVGMAWIDIVVSDRRAREALGYEPLVSRAECIAEAKEWCRAFYAGLGE
uniref:3-beta hydroxysteroid dehydrogenase/isomerase domain-containing protein n=1 Tax=Prymnesium polylepis TaxID=72548 RepID=A0A7S4HF35_9EUKA|mmetsp:Transcript_14982/g.38158  ORF Transcript_14982/g.38158 Transcript_14982/m.38158 type:complete len:362 (+) Transcript_14982:10-1095(+)